MPLVYKSIVHYQTGAKAVAASLFIRLPDPGQCHSSDPDHSSDPFGAASHYRWEERQSSALPFQKIQQNAKRVFYIFM